MSSRTNRKQKRTGKKMWGMVNIGLTILYTVFFRSAAMSGAVQMRSRWSCRYRKTPAAPSR